MKIFQGVYPVLPTPLKNGRVDTDAIQYFVDYFSDKVQGLVVLGSGGEFIYLSEEEKKKIITASLKSKRKNFQIIIGTGYTGTDETLNISKFAQDKGADGLLIALPTYHPLKFDMVYKHFETLSSKLEVRIIYYHFPEATHLYLKPSEVAKICDIDNIVGIKESTLNLKEIKNHITLIKRQDFSVLAGSSFMFLSVLKLGGCGVICPIPAIIPQEVVKLYEYFYQGNLRLCDEMEAKIFECLPILSSTTIPFARFFLKTLSGMGVPLKGAANPFHSVIKCALEELGHPISSEVKSPLPQVSEKDRIRIKKVLNAIKWR